MIKVDDYDSKSYKLIFMLNDGTNTVIKSVDVPCNEYIVGLAIGTRPDCLSDDVIELLGEINKLEEQEYTYGFTEKEVETAKYQYEKILKNK